MQIGGYNIDGEKGTTRQEQKKKDLYIIYTYDMEGDPTANVDEVVNYQLELQRNAFEEAYKAGEMTDYDYESSLEFLESSNYRNALRHTYAYQAGDSESAKNPFETNTERIKNARAIKEAYNNVHTFGMTGNLEEDRKAVAEFIKNAKEGQDWMFQGHTSSTLANVSLPKEIAPLVNEKNPENCYLGMCHGEYLTSDKFNLPEKLYDEGEEPPNFYYEHDQKWWGPNPEGEDVMSVLFGTDDATSKTDKAEEGVNYTKWEPK